MTVRRGSLTRYSLLILGLWCAFVPSGCAVSGRSMQVDSISRMPWFNFEFMERRRKSDGPAHREVRLDAPEKARIEKLVDNRKSDATIQLSDKSRRSLPTTDRIALESAAADASEFDFR